MIENGIFEVLQMVLKQVLIVNSDLKMGRGKIAVQIAHGEVAYMRHIMHSVVDYIQSTNVYTEQMRRYHRWQTGENNLMKKVVLKAPKHVMIEQASKAMARNIWYHCVYDRGLTQVPENSLTCIVFEPLPENRCDELFGDLKLL